MGKSNAHTVREQLQGNSCTKKRFSDSVQVDLPLSSSKQTRVQGWSVHLCLVIIGLVDSLKKIFIIILIIHSVLNVYAKLPFYLFKCILESCFYSYLHFLTWGHISLPYPEDCFWWVTQVFEDCSLLIRDFFYYQLWSSSMTWQSCPLASSHVLSFFLIVFHTVDFGLKSECL